MKIQDIAFFLALITLLIIRKPTLFVYAGLLCFALAIPLFAGWIFFTGERLTWYGAGFLLAGIILNTKKKE